MKHFIYRIKNKKTRIYVVVFFLVFILLSTGYHNIMLKIEANRYKPPGQIIEVYGHGMHIYSEGNIDKQPTVVMTCGSGTPSAYTEFSNIQPIIARITRTCIYERPGYGWSESTSNSRSTEQIVEELRTLLSKSGEKPPYLFVAHSMGAMEVLLYTHKYPEEVAGIVLIDGTSPYKHINYPESSIPISGIKTLRILNNIGFIRIASELNLIPMLNNRLKSMSDEVREIEKSMIYKNIFNDMVLREGDLLQETAKEMNEELDFGDMPIAVLAADKSINELPGWEISQNSLLKLSTDSKLLVVENTNHISILHDNVNDIVNVIDKMIEKINSSK